MRYSDPNLKSPFLRQVLEMDFTVWNQDFSVIQILREIDWRIFEILKIFFCHFRGPGMDCINMVHLRLQIH